MTAGVLLEEPGGCLRIAVTAGETVVLGRAPWEGLDPALRAAPRLRLLAHPGPGWTARVASISYVDWDFLVRDERAPSRPPIRVRPGGGVALGGVYVTARAPAGGTLAEEIARRGPDPELVIAAGLAVASDLERLHARGLHHGDLLPREILVEPGAPAKLCYPGEGPFAGGEGSGVCRNPLHLAPEVLARGATSAAGDFYALGSVLWEALAGTPPFPHATIAELVTAAAAGPPAAPATWPPSLAAVLRDLLVPDPARRLTSHADLRARLEAAAGEWRAHALDRQVRLADAAYGRMYDAHGRSAAAAAYADVEDAMVDAIRLARALGLHDRAAELERTLDHRRAVYRHQFS